MSTENDDFEIDPERFAEREVQADEAQFAPPAPPRGEVHHRGVVWRGPWDQLADGTAVATRLHALALAELMPVKLYASAMLMEPLPGRAAVAGRDLDPLVIAQVGHLRETELNSARAIVHHAVPTHDRLHHALYPGHTDALDKEVAEAMHPRRISLTVWERNRVDARTATLLRRFGQCWVPCERNRKLLLDAGVDRAKAHVVPHPIDPTTPLESFRELPTGSKAYTFLAIGKWEPRKNLDAVIGAFLLAFRAGGKARLIVKTMGFARVPGYPYDVSDSLKTWLANEAVKANGWKSENVGKQMLLLDKSLSTIDMWKLYQGSDAFVSASHGEGFDLPAFDACLAGLRLIHVGFGGSEDYAPPGSLRVWDEAVDGLEDVHAMYPWTRAQWAKVDTASVAEAMRVAAFDEGRGRIDFDSSPYTMSAVGRRMAKLIEELDR